MVLPITYGCDKQITEIKSNIRTNIKRIQLKEAFVGADSYV